MKITNIHEAKTHLLRLIESSIAGEEVIIAKAGKPLVKLIPYEVNQQPSQPGGGERKVKMTKDFDNELSTELKINLRREI